MTIKFGNGLGAALAVSMSYSLHHHFGWAAIHGFFHWFYVGYYLLSQY